jgi:hypothetical protein
VTGETEKRKESRSSAQEWGKALRRAGKITEYRRITEDKQAGRREGEIKQGEKGRAEAD